MTAFRPGHNLGFRNVRTFRQDAQIAEEAAIGSNQATLSSAPLFGREMPSVRRFRAGGGADVCTNRRVVLRKKSTSSLGAQNAQRRCEAVGSDPLLGHDRDEGVMGEAEPGPGIDDVGVAGPVDLDELMRVPGGRNGRVIEPERLCLILGAGSRKANGPAGLPGRRSAHHEVAPGLNQGAGYPLGGQRVEGTVEDVSLRDSPGVQLHRIRSEPDRPAGCIQVHLLPPDPGRRTTQGRRVGQGASFAGGRPKVEVGTRRKVEGPVGPTRKTLGTPKHGKERTTHRNGGFVGPVCQSIEFARCPIAAQHRFQVLHKTECGSAGPPRHRIVRGIQHRSHGHSHLGLAVLVPFELPLPASVRDEETGGQ